MKEAGFTLAEMLVVLAIMAALVAISVPYSAKSGDARKLAATAQIVAAKLRESRATALAGNRERSLTFDIKKRLVSGASKDFALPDGIDLKIVTAANEVAEDTASFRFFPDGGATGGRIILARNGESEEIAINWLTGAVVITEGGAP